MHTMFIFYTLADMQNFLLVKSFLLRCLRNETLKLNFKFSKNVFLFCLRSKKSRINNTKINGLYEICVRIIYNDTTSSFEKLLEKGCFSFYTQQKSSDSSDRDV